jgi:hypothetical protein
MWFSGSAARENIAPEVAVLSMQRQKAVKTNAIVFLTSVCKGLRVQTPL